MRANIGSAHQNVGAQLAFNSQVPIINRRRLVLVNGIPAQDECSQTKGDVLCRRIGKGKRIVPGLVRTTLESLRRRQGTKRISKGTRIDDARIEHELGTERCQIRKAVVDNARDAGVIKNSEAARSEEHTSELQSRVDLVCRLLL